jgi:Sulfotransferase family
MTPNDAPEPGPVIVLTASRSGSTLLRFILDSNPELGCPPETGLGQASRGLAQLWTTLADASQSRTDDFQPRKHLDERAAQAMRTVISGFYSDYLDSRGKRRWCDKSLDNFMFAGLIGQIFPNARFICLYRHCMDVIASGVETSPWGLQGFGFSEYAHQYPGNSVAAIGSYWLNVARTMLAFEQEEPDRCLRIRYEDLVTQPEVTAAAVFDFIGAPPVPDIVARCLTEDHDKSGPADSKIWFTKEISRASIGRGVTVPIGALSPPAVEAINQTLADLDYRMIDERWNLSVGPLDPRAGHDTAEHGPGESANIAAAIAIRDAVISQLTSRLVDGMSVSGGAADRWSVLNGRHVHIMIENGLCPPGEVSWLFGTGPIQLTELVGDQEADAEAEPCALIVGPAATWQALLEGKANMAIELNAGRIRCTSGLKPGGPPLETRALGELLGLAASLAA